MAIEILRRKPPSEHIVTELALNLIRGFEGLHLSAYPDPASELARTGKGLGDPWTIGWGRAKGVKRGEKCTLEQANAWLREDAEEAADKVRQHFTVPLTVGEFAALVSMAYNLRNFPAPSLKACLEGGITDKGKVMEPGSYGDALLQFPRNCRGKGKPMKGLYRRRLAEACVFAGFPWENACSPTVVRFELGEDGEIDDDATTSLEDAILRARMDMPQQPNPAVILNKPWAELAPATPIKPPPELVLDTPAPETSKPAPRDDGPASAGPAAVGPESRPLPVPAPVAPPAARAPQPPPPVIIAPKTVDVKSIPYGEISPDNGAKNMSESQRGVGMVIVGAGSLIQIVTARLGVGTAIGAVAFDLSRDPVVIALLATGIVTLIGWLMRKKGTKVMTTGMVNATQVLK